MRRVKLMLREATNSIPCMRAAQMTRQGGREDEKKTRGKIKKIYLSYLLLPPLPFSGWLLSLGGERVAAPRSLPKTKMGGQWLRSFNVSKMGE